MKLDWKALVGLVITVVLLWWVFRDTDFAEVWAEVRRAHWGYLAASVFVATAGFGIRALRWKVILAPVKADTGLRSRFAAVNIGFMANNIFPARIGEFARAYALSRMEPVPVSAALGSLVVERFLDGVVLMSFLLLAMAAPTFPADASVSEGPQGTALKGFAVLLVVGVAGLFALIRWPGPCVRFAERVARRLPGDFARPLVAALEAFLDALVILKRPTLLLKAFVWTVGFWAWHGTSFWLGMKAFGIDLDLVAAYFVEAVVGFGVAVPSAPGFFGTFHAAADWALSGVYGVDPATSLAFAFGYHLGGFIPVTLIGLWYAWRMGFSLKDVERSEGRVEGAVERDHPGAAPLPDAMDSDGGAADAARASSRRDWDGAEPSPGAVSVDAPAKINLSLRVGTAGPDGYHAIETLFQAIDLCDRVGVSRAAPGVAIDVEGVPVPGDVADNLAVRAARAFARAAGVAPSWRIALEKRIPAGAGLGGGSSDAASTLLALERLEGGPLGASRLMDVARQLGADVAFFLGASPMARGRGRGELLSALAPLPSAELVLAIPGVHVSTGEAYRALDADRGGASVTATTTPQGGKAPASAALEGGKAPASAGLEGGAPPGSRAQAHGDDPPAWRDVAASAHNDFERVVADAHRPVAQALAALRAGSPMLALLCGSGGASFALYADAVRADAAAAALKETLPGVEVVRCRTLDAWPDSRGADALLGADRGGG